MPNKIAYRNLCANLKNIRITKGFSQEYVAGRLGISQNAYSKQELGYSQITLIALMRLSSIFDYGFTELLELLTGAPLVAHRKKVLPE